MPVTLMWPWSASARAVAMRCVSGGRGVVVLQGVTGRHKPPDPIELEPAQGGQARHAMAVMGRVESAAEQPDAQTGGVWRQAQLLGAHGRT
jgi:hypothetical protein